MLTAVHAASKAPNSGILEAEAVPISQPQDERRLPRLGRMGAIGIHHGGASIRGIGHPDRLMVEPDSAKGQVLPDA